MHFHGRYGFDKIGLVVNAVLVVVHKKEGLVLFYRSSQAAAELILVIQRPRWGEEIPGVEILVSQKLVAGTMKLIAARFRGDVNHRRQRSAALSRIAVGLDVHLLDRFQGRLDSHPAHDALLVIHTVYHLPILVFGQPVHGHGRCLAAVIRPIAADGRGCRPFGCSGGQLDNVDDVTADNRNILHNLAVELRRDV